MSVKGQRTIPRDVRDVICKLYVFMKKEAIEGPILLKKVQERVALAVGVSRSSVQRILRDENKIKGIVETAVATTSKIFNFCKTTVPLFSYVDVNDIKSFADPVTEDDEEKVALPTLNRDTECGPPQEKQIKLEPKDLEEDIEKQIPSGVLIKNEVFINDSVVDSSDTFHQEGSCLTTASLVSYSSETEEESSSGTRIPNGQQGEKDIYSRFGEIVANSLRSLKQDHLQEKLEHLIQYEHLRKKFEQLICKAVVEVSIKD